MGKTHYSGIDDIPRADIKSARAGNTTKKITGKRRKTSVRGR